MIIYDVDVKYTSIETGQDHLAQVEVFMDERAVNFGDSNIDTARTTAKAVAKRKLLHKMELRDEPILIQEAEVKSVNKCNMIARLY